MKPLSSNGQENLAGATFHARTDNTYIVAGPGSGTFEFADFVNAKAGGMVWGKAFLQTLYVADLFYIACITFIKLSILSFFHNLFFISVAFQRWDSPLPSSSSGFRLPPPQRLPMPPCPHALGRHELC
ncbi:uncharacterized protein LDX57_001984 [Aspergillus melleus]|uniref:uncharacterized protein n=1 Tax=Aspergillus melleus TaxID=138277 RepID=UPI001E8EE2AA|nr:uncharacterized protein LDX57_001984 [Aspergillus melleus]KAH8424226.1 hypothetical protein LDX57_001984 [Aspergillus melleus]